MQLGIRRSNRSATVQWSLAVMLACVLPAGVHAAEAPSTQPTLNAEQARLHRGLQVRQVLLETVEQSYRDGGVWPDQLSLADADGLKLVYLRPAKPVSPPKFGTVALAASAAPVTVVLYEPIDQHADGAWLGYADGHLEFVSTAPDLANALDQSRLVTPTFEATTQPAPSAGNLTLKVLDPDGHPVSGAMVGIWANFGNAYPRLRRVRFANDADPSQTTTNDKGEVTISAVTAFDAKFVDQPAVPLFILDQQRQLVAQVEAERADFAQGQIREVHLSPACNVHGQLTSVGLMAAGKSIGWKNIIAFKPGRLRYYTLQSTSNGPAFNLLLPSGDYGIQAYGSDCDSVYRYFHIEPGQRQLNLELDLPPDTIAQLIGKPAPEFKNVQGWEHGGPVKIADLRGKVVLLDFWGYWCGPCVRGMPVLMKLYDEFKDKGLVIIAVHDDSVDSIQQMDRKLEKIRQLPWAGWGGRDLPFLIALDGGGPTRIQYTGTTDRGATTAAYGITSFPTTVAIARDGRVVGEVSPGSPQGRLEIEKLIDTGDLPQN
ncbi:MAG: redoxin domain-containing protein [Tepidisphaeraceae bacterium]|jgi:thiol-disulfide isomerase/thioredoxin